MRPLDERVGIVALNGIAITAAQPARKFCAGACLKQCSKRPPRCRLSICAIQVGIQGRARRRHPSPQLAMVGSRLPGKSDAASACRVDTQGWFP